MADNIKVNSGQWQSLSKDDQERVSNILKTTGLLKEGATIAPEPSLAAAGVHVFGNPFCKIGCDLAESAAVAACALLTGPAVAICIAAAHAGGELCRSRC
jgi:hypothetical protein